MSVTWKDPPIPGAPYFASWEGATFAFVTSTAFADGRWRVSVFPSGDDDGRGPSAYVRSLALGKKFVERWAAHNHERIAPAKGRQIMPHEGMKPRKPKGLEDRS